MRRLFCAFVVCIWHKTHFCMASGPFANETLGNQQTSHRLLINKFWKGDSFETRKLHKKWIYQTRFYWVCSWAVIINATLLMSSSSTVWAATWQNQQNDCVPSEDSAQSGHPPSLISVFTVPQTGRMPRLIRVFAGRTLTLLVLSCHGSYLKQPEWAHRS